MIRQATIEDMPRIMQMAEKFYEKTHYVEHVPLNFDSVAFLSTTLIQHGIVLVAEVDGVVVGMTGLVLLPCLFNTDYIGAHEVVWWVEPEHQDSGIGRALLEAIEPACKNREVDFIQMVLLPNSPLKAQTLYNSLRYYHSETSYTKVL